VAARRARILDAMAKLVGERGFAGASVGLVTARAKVSSRTFYELFESREDCFLAVMDEQTERAAALVRYAFERESSWRDGLRAALTTLLVFLDSEPVLARVWLVEALAAGSWALERRANNISRLTSQIIAAWELPDGWQPPPLAAEAAMTSVLGVLHNHLVTASPEPLISLLGPLMGVITRPYLDERAVKREIERGEQLANEIQAGRPWPLPAAVGAGAEIPRFVAHPSAHRARQCLLYIAQNPETSNRQIADGIGVNHLGQASTLLARLAGLGLLEKEQALPGGANAWRLTADGVRVTEALEHAPATSHDRVPNPARAEQ
jgi:AcrR family transcriptional regulator